jgi:hypothetical protein
MLYNLSLTSASIEWALIVATGLIMDGWFGIGRSNFWDKIPSHKTWKYMHNELYPNVSSEEVIARRLYMEYFLSSNTSTEDLLNFLKSLIQYNYPCQEIYFMLLI